jgi:alkanesulfonate monooxygenase SsuD/methylene tetrahydromethanopterin reductase-like flavin-dependent oxidoreductase (luciferase family)
MRIGISITSAYPLEDVRLGARYMIERAQAAAAAELDSLFVGDHHVTPTPYYQNTPMLARMLAHWRQAPAGALYLLPFRHPVLLAEEIATLAALAPDRFILQCALGYGDREFAAFGINPKHRPSRFEESLQIMQKLWAGESVTHHGRWQIEAARIAPTPPSKIEVWIAGQADAAIERAARLGDGWIAAPGLTPVQAKADLARYVDYCAAHGRTPGVCAIRRDIYIGETQAEAEATGGKVIAAGYRGFAPEATIVGDVERVATAFNELAEAGFTDILIRNLVSEQAKALATIARLVDVKELVSV